MKKVTKIQVSTSILEQTKDLRPIGITTDFDKAKTFNPIGIPAEF
ncbi:hypothetical protein [Tumebacillus lipolyticus]|uniref:Uncharacterized protein n=1 Tax=Tumebacillus lipolyticus TaxID=1280370 RepID=A0ABW4ZX07_9BACL